MMIDDDEPRVQASARRAGSRSWPCASRVPIPRPLPRRQRRAGGAPVYRRRGNPWGRGTWLFFAGNTWIVSDDVNKDKRAFRGWAYRNATMAPGTLPQEAQGQWKVVAGREKKYVVQNVTVEAKAAGKPKQQSGASSERMMRWEAFAGGYNDNTRNSAPRSSISKEGPGRKIERSRSKLGRDLLALAATATAAAAAEEGDGDGEWAEPEASTVLLQQAIARQDERAAAAAAEGAGDASAMEAGRSSSTRRGSRSGGGRPPPPRPDDVSEADLTI